MAQEWAGHSIVHPANSAHPKAQAAMPFANFLGSVGPPADGFSSCSHASLFDDHARASSFVDWQAGTVHPTSFPTHTRPLTRHPPKQRDEILEQILTASDDSSLGATSQIAQDQPPRHKQHSRSNLQAGEPNPAPSPAALQPPVWQPAATSVSEQQPPGAQPAQQLHPELQGLVHTQPLAVQPSASQLRLDRLSESAAANAQLLPSGYNLGHRNDVPRMVGSFRLPPVWIQVPQSAVPPNLPPPPGASNAMAASPGPMWPEAAAEAAAALASRLRGPISTLAGMETPSDAPAEGAGERHTSGHLQQHHGRLQLSSEHSQSLQEDQPPSYSVEASPGNDQAWPILYQPTPSASPSVQSPYSIAMAAGAAPPSLLYSYTAEDARPSTLPFPAEEDGNGMGLQGSRPDSDRPGRAQEFDAKSPALTQPATSFADAPVKSSETRQAGLFSLPAERMVAQPDAAVMEEDPGLLQGSQKGFVQRQLWRFPSGAAPEGLAAAMAAGVTLAADPEAAAEEADSPASSASSKRLDGVLQPGPDGINSVKSPQGSATNGPAAECSHAAAAETASGGLPRVLPTPIMHKPEYRSGTLASCIGAICYLACMI